MVICPKILKNNTLTIYRLIKFETVKKKLTHKRGSCQAESKFCFMYMKIYIGSKDVKKMDYVHCKIDAMIKEIIY